MLQITVIILFLTATAHSDREIRHTVQGRVFCNGNATKERPKIFMIYENEKINRNLCHLNGGRSATI
uniref:Uncharacterized protein n=1 Tax=Romanomermis culicivorax TaxID=13658 RepID=A0A915K8A5_ROMCU